MWLLRRLERNQGRGCCYEILYQRSALQEEVGDQGADTYGPRCLYHSQRSNGGEDEEDPSGDPNEWFVQRYSGGDNVELYTGSPRSLGLRV